jgi:hypothetical protein
MNVTNSIIFIILFFYCISLRASIIDVKKTKLLQGYIDELLLKKNKSKFIGVQIPSSSPTPKLEPQFLTSGTH